jgi:hypothetical protein
MHRMPVSKKIRWRRQSRHEFLQGGHDRKSRAFGFRKRHRLLERPRDSDHHESGLGQTRLHVKAITTSTRGASASRLGSAIRPARPEIWVVGSMLRQSQFALGQIPGSSLNWWRK